MKLTLESFFSQLILHPWEAETNKDKKNALVASIACGIFTLGICHAVCAVKKYFKAKVADQLPALKQRFSHLTTSIFKPVEKTNPLHNFIKSINPSNIDQLLALDKNLRCVDKWSLDFNRCITSTDDGATESEVIYSCVLEGETFGGIRRRTWLDLEVENGQFKCHENGTKDTYHYFDHLDGVLRYLFKGDFYHGEYYRVDYYLMTRSDNTVIKYLNPYQVP